VRSVIAEAIGPAFKYLTDPDQATEALLTLAEDKDRFLCEGMQLKPLFRFENLTDLDQAEKPC